MRRFQSVRLNRAPRSTSRFGGSRPSRGAGHRRDWSAEDEARILAGRFEPGETASAVSRRHALSPQQLFTCRSDIRKAAEGGAS